MSYAKRIDQNQNQLVKIARSMGVSVAITSGIGHGFPDSVWGFSNGQNVLVEIKDGSKPPSQRKLTKDEQKFHDNWKGHITVITNVEDALKLIERINQNKC